MMDAMKDPDIPPRTDYSEDGVDLTLIRWMLSLSPAQRPQFLQSQINAILAIRRLITTGSKPVESLGD
jgi:hypothetical protein